MNRTSILVISPHFKLFIKDQLIVASRFFSKITVLIPRPYFPGFLLNVPFFENNFLFIKNAIDSCNKSLPSSGISLISPKFFSLPIEVMRKRVPLLSAKSSMRMIKRCSVKFDLIHTHRLDIGFTGAILKDEYEKPLIVTCHGSDAYDFPFKDAYRQAIAKYTLSRADHVIAVCKSDSEKLLSLGLQTKKLSIIPNGFDDDLFRPFSPQLARKKLGLPHDKKILLSVGTLHDVKGQIYLIDAMYALSKARNDLLAVIVGSGPLETRLRKEIERLDLERNVLLVGREPHDKIPLWLNASDIFVLPSLNEGSPTVIPEAMACGKPVIGSRVGGVPDVISNDSVGILVNPKDPESLVQAVLELLNKGWDSEQIQTHAQEYSLKNVVKQILQVYQQIIQP